MAIRSKPPQSVSAVDERVVEAFIGKGGAVAESVHKQQAKKLQLRIPVDLIRRIDAARPKGIAAPSRHDWFLQAILEKLQREEQKSV